MLLHQPWSEMSLWFLSQQTYFQVYLRMEGDCGSYLLKFTHSAFSFSLSGSLKKLTTKAVGMNA